jgi:hypothetical protein
MDVTNQIITVTDKMVLIDGTPTCFATTKDSREHMDRWINAPLDVNLNGDAYASDKDDSYADATVGYNCIAWPEV